MPLTDRVVLNVGGGASRTLPSQFNGWKQHLLDIDPEVNPDIVCDARELGKIKTRYDAVFCSHNLEHFYRHDVPKVLGGFTHVLKEDGFAHIIVPDFSRLLEAIRGRDIDDVWYTASKPVTFHDVLYGWNYAMERGNLYYSHKCAFTEKSLTKVLKHHFRHVFTAADEAGNLMAYAFKSKPTKAQERLCL